MPLHMTTRREFLQRSAQAAFMASLLPAQVMAQPADFWSQPRSLWLKRVATGEEIRQVYFANGQIVWPGYQAVCTLLRDVQAQQAVQMDLVLLDILCGVQGVLAGHGVHAPLHTHSGFRTPKTNNALENASRSSQHLQGKAWDGGVPGVHSEFFSRAAIYLRGGGVGLYRSQQFTHLDSGNLRFWSI